MPTAHPDPRTGKRPNDRTSTARPANIGLWESGTYTKWTEHRSACIVAVHEAASSTRSHYISTRQEVHRITRDPTLRCAISALTERPTILRPRVLCASSLAAGDECGRSETPRAGPCRVDGPRSPRASSSGPSQRLHPERPDQRRPASPRHGRARRSRRPRHPTRRPAWSSVRGRVPGGLGHCSCARAPAPRRWSVHRSDRVVDDVAAPRGIRRLVRPHVHGHAPEPPLQRNVTQDGRRAPERL